mgnify:CR=1 FL=1
MNTFAADVLGCKTPLILAPLAHLASNELIATITNAGGIGTLPVHRLRPEQTRERLQHIRSLTNGPIMVSFTGEWERDENLDVILEFEIQLAMVFWWNAPRLIHRLQAHGIKVGWQIGTDDQLSDALSRDADFIIAQGLEAGGHRGMFLTDDLSTQIGTFALLPQIVNAVRVPVIAAGGIATSQGVVAARHMGASGVQIGTAYLCSHEATTSALHRAVLQSPAAQHTALTNLFTGRPARGIVNRVMRELGPIGAQVPAFPLATAAIASLRAAAESAGSSDFTPLWSGQNTCGTRHLGAADITQDFVRAWQATA